MRSDVYNDRDDQETLGEGSVDAQDKYEEEMNEYLYIPEVEAEMKPAIHRCFVTSGTVSPDCKRLIYPGGGVISVEGRLPRCVAVTIFSTLSLLGQVVDVPTRSRTGDFAEGHLRDCCC